MAPSYRWKGWTPLHPDDSSCRFSAWKLSETTRSEVDCCNIRNSSELDLVRGSDNGRCGERGVAAELGIAQMTTPIGMPMGSYLLGSTAGSLQREPRTPAHSLKDEGLGAVASRRLAPTIGFRLGNQAASWGNTFGAWRLSIRVIGGL
jgi:hypothetical protein